MCCVNYISWLLFIFFSFVVVVVGFNIAQVLLTSFRSPVSRLGIVMFFYLILFLTSHIVQVNPCLFVCLFGFLKENFQFICFDNRAFSLAVSFNELISFSLKRSAIYFLLTFAIVERHHKCYGFYSLYVMFTDQLRSSDHRTLQEIIVLILTMTIIISIKSSSMTAHILFNFNV